MQNFTRLRFFIIYIFFHLLYGEIQHLICRYIVSLIFNVSFVCFGIHAGTYFCLYYYTFSVSNIYCTFFSISELVNWAISDLVVQKGLKKKTFFHVAFSLAGCVFSLYSYFSSSVRWNTTLNMRAHSFFGI